ncbi:4Fe-4S dicluster domain-containing protein [Desulfobacula sp.]|uniref:4Fe-4S dicluster domain-containing protein n=1 Tax=Desulfobacula sp. TaxID=2593537 RepID=UPI00260CC729|nr:4Fe-4S dicluster domain-containing protein [Desulfobacula sp.]
MKNYAILLDATICTGCNSCTYKCIQENRFHAQASQGLFRTVVEIKDEGIRHYRCMICKDPACVEACPEGALTQSEYGSVLYDANACVGCEACVDACPFGVPQYDPMTQKIVRCNMCAHRVKDGGLPACVEVCPSDALCFGEYNAIVALAKKRTIEEHLNLYGLTEAGGCRFITLMKQAPADLGYPNVVQRAQNKPAMDVTLPGMAALAIGGFKTFSNRRARLETEEKEKSTP